MNGTVEKIVNTLFSGLENTPETNAMRDELLANCQERFADLLSAGKSEDEAIAGVVESLKGMEDVLAGYPRVQPTKRAGETLYRFPGEGLSKIRCRLREDDLTIEACEGNQVTVLYERDDDEVLEVEMKDGLLYIAQPSLRESWWQRLLSLSFRKGCVRVLIPQTAAPSLDADGMSGDVRISGVTLSGAVNVKTMSGEVVVHGKGRADSATLSTASGELTLRLDADNVRLKSVSGNVDYSGECQSLTANSISGEVQAQTNAGEAALQSVSGNVRLHRMSNASARINAQTTSGNVRVELPRDSSARLIAASVSGRIRNDFEDATGDAVVVKANSISGNVELRGF